MSSGTNENVGEDVSPDFARMYYEHQYQRFAYLEQHGFTISNLVIGVCLLALAWTSDTSVELEAGAHVVLLHLVVALNAVAIVYLIRVFFAKRSHQKRAKAVLRHYARFLLEIDGEFPQPAPISPFKRSFIQMGFHAIIIIASVALV
jgi:hypothetical protein